MSPAEEKKFYEEEYGLIYSEEKGVTPEGLFEARQGDAGMYLDWTRAYLKPTDVCLEIGCASGYFLALIRDRVSSVMGVETHLALRRHCEDIGIPMHESLDEYGENSVDRLFAYFVLEHLSDPLPFLAQAGKVCRPGGNIIIVVPNVDEALLTEYRVDAFRDFYFTPAHAFYYSPATLSALFEKGGFSRFDILPKQRYDLSNHMHWMMTGEPGGMGRFDHLFDQALQDAYRESLEARFKCDTLFAVITV